MLLERGIFVSMTRLITFLALFVSLSFVYSQDSGSEGGDFSGFSSSGQGGGSSPGGSMVGLTVGENYVIKPSDVLQLSVYQEDDLDKMVRVEGDGTVALALIGKVRVAGMTVAEAQSLVTELYNRDFLVDPQVSLLVVEFAPRVVRILGAVNRPGVVMMPPDRELTLTEAIAGVNGISRLGNPKSVQIKRVEEGGATQLIEVNFSRIMSDPKVRDITLKENDSVWVPERII